METVGNTYLLTTRTLSGLVLSPSGRGRCAIVATGDCDLRRLLSADLS
jgi:hypothetical protein